MSNIEVGAVLTGKVTGIQPFGAFVALDENTQGLVHISEVSNTFVKNINDYLKVGEEVKVKVLAISEDRKRINLSIKALQPATEKPVQKSNRKPSNRRPSKKINKIKNNDAEGYNILGEKLKEALNLKK